MPRIPRSNNTHGNKERRGSYTRKRATITLVMGANDVSRDTPRYFIHYMNTAVSKNSLPIETLLALKRVVEHTQYHPNTECSAARLAWVRRPHAVSAE